MRGSQEIPIGKRTVIERGDVLQLTGPDRAVETRCRDHRRDRAALRHHGFCRHGVGHLCRGGHRCDNLGAARVESILPSAPAWAPLWRASSLVTSARCDPIFGRIPDGAIAFMQSFGLAAFVAMVGIGAGPEFFVAIKEAGWGLLFGGVVVTLVSANRWPLLRPIRAEAESAAPVSAACPEPRRSPGPWRRFRKSPAVRSRFSGIPALSRSLISCSRLGGR